MIRYVTMKQMQKVLDHEDNRKDTFIAQEDNQFLAVDNTSGDAFNEEFDTLWGAIKWCSFKYLTAEDVRKQERVKKAFDKPLNLSI